MISAIQNNNPSFTSVIPVRVYIDGLETFDKKLIQSSCRKLSSALVGTKPKRIDIMRTLAQKDPHYKLGLDGNFVPPARPWSRVKAIPSDFFKYITNKGKTFLFTGEQAIKLGTAGKAIGEETAACKTRGVENSFDLMVAKKNYGNIVQDCLNSPKLRIYDKLVPKKSDPLTLNINMRSNKKYARKDFQIELDNITFVK
jgi:hypothetical protein